MNQQQQAQLNPQYSEYTIKGQENNHGEDYDENYQHENEYDEGQQINQNNQEYNQSNQRGYNQNQQYYNNQQDQYNEQERTNIDLSHDPNIIAHQHKHNQYIQQIQQLQAQNSLSQNASNKYQNQQPQQQYQQKQQGQVSFNMNKSNQQQQQRQLAHIPPNTQVYQPPSAQNQQQQYANYQQSSQNRLSVSFDENKNQQQQSFLKDQRIISPSKSSKEVLQKVFDDESSTQNRQRGQRSNHSDQRKEDAMNALSQNISQIKLNESTNESKNIGNIKNDNDKSNRSSQHIRRDGENDVSQQYDQANSNLNKSGQENNNDIPDQVDLSLFDSCYKEFLQKIAADQAFVDASYEQKIDILINFFHDELLNYRLGSLIFLFELIYNFRESLTEQAVTQILNKIYANIPHYYETKDFYMVYCALEIIALIGPHSISFNHIKLLASILIDEALPILQDKAFLALINFDYPGFYALLDIANKDFNDIPIYLLNKFAQTEEIQISVIIPSLQNDINSAGDMKKRISSLCALNHMYSMIWKANSLPQLVNLLNEGSLDRQLVVSTIRACGEIGEQTLLKSTNNKIKQAICTALSWRVKKNEKNKLGIRVVPYNISQHYNINPGTMCIYYGNQTPLAFIEDDYDLSQDYIEINSRDFMAALQRLLAVKYDKFQDQQEGYQQQLHNYSGYLNDFTLIKLIDPSVSNEEDIPQVSSNVIKSLCSQLVDQNVQVREIAVSTLGNIGMPEAEQAIDSLYDALNDPESQVRSMAAWCLGIIGENNPPKVAQRLIQLLKDSYWKVRTAACVSIGSLGSQIANIAFPALTKILRDGSINKLTVCETLVRLGVYGEQILIDLIKTVPSSNFKLKTSIIQAFELANVQSPTIDFIIEELFKNASFGPQAELMFIEGLTKDKNPIIRQECAKGLGYLGVQNFRALLFGLRDVNEGVRKTTALTIQSNFVAEQIVDEFSDKQNQLPALLGNIKDIFGLQFYIDENCRAILEQILTAFGESTYVINNHGNINIINPNNNYTGNLSMSQSAHGNERQKPQSNISFNHSFDKQQNPVQNMQKTPQQFKPAKFSGLQSVKQQAVFNVKQYKPNNYAQI